MALAHFSILIHEFLNKDPDIFSGESPLIILDSNSSVCTDNYGKDTKKIRNITIILHFVSNGEK